MSRIVLGLMGDRLSSIKPVEWRAIAAISIAAILACLGTAHLLSLPPVPGFNGSLLCGPSPVAAVIETGIVTLACVVVGAIAILLVADEAGMLCVCIGLAALAVRCGSIRSVLQLATGKGVFASLAIESVLLFGLVCGAWILLRIVSAFARGKRMSEPTYIAPNEVAAPDLKSKLSTLGIQILVMAICEMFLIQTDAKAQALMGVGVAGFVAAMVAYAYLPLADGFWYWAGPSALAVLAYVVAMFNSTGLDLGEVHGWASPLARATPLDYASLGTAGALLGYWSGRRWAQPDETPTQTAENQEAAG